MKNLHRELAPISEAAWANLEGEIRSTFATRIAARRFVDMPEARGTEFSSLTTGREAEATSPVEAVRARRREVLPVVELRAPFTLSREEIDAVARGAVDPDWGPAQDAAAQLARAEDSAVFEGLDGITGIIPATPNAAIGLPESIRELPDAVSRAIEAVRLAYVGGPYSLLLSAELYTQVVETVDHGYPVLAHIQRALGEGRIMWAPNLTGALLVSERGGDFELHLGQDLSVGYLAHDAQTVTLYLQESLTFRIATPEAAVALRG